MKITEITVESKLDEYGNSPNDSIDPRFAGGAPQSINNLKARRLARAAKTTAATAPTTAPTTPAATTTAPTKPTVPGQPDDTAADATADTTPATPGKPAVPGQPAVKGKKGFWSGLMRGMGANDAANAIDDYNKSGDRAAIAPQPAVPGQPGSTTSATKPVTPAKPNPIDGTPGVTEPTPGPAPVGKGTPAPEPAADATQNLVFRDPAAFKAEWDKFIKAQPENYKLITNTELLGVLKDMWKYSGGVRAESKNNKKQGLKK